MHFFDTHIHIQDYTNAVEDVIAGLKKNGVDRVFCVSAHEADWPKVAALADKFPEFVVPAFAIHPWYISEMSDCWINNLTDYLQAYPQAAVGECGFDSLKNSDFAMQKAAFDVQIELARKFSRPLLVHAVKAWEWLNGYWAKLPEKFVFHSFNARPENLRKIAESGGYISVNERILKNKTAGEILNQIPLNRLLLESDAPYQGKAENLMYLCREIARIRDMDEETLADVIYANSEEMLK